MARKTGNQRALVLAEALDAANGTFLDNDKSPARKVGQTDNRGSHFYLALYWAQALAAQDSDATLQAQFKPVAAALTRDEARIAGELIGAQGRAMDVGGYYHPSPAACATAMRPSPTLNAILASIGS
jgi:isocitrate dehydrogenase